MKRSKKGFTLAELLIVIAIIAVLIAIMFPVFGAQLDKARAAAELANVRAAYSEAVANAMLGTTNDLTATVSNVEINWQDLKDACQDATNTKVGVSENPPSAATDVADMTTSSTEKPGGYISVAYKTYFGSFKIDDDVTVKKPA